MLNQLFRRLIMSLKAGIVGLPNVGKSTLFNAITKQNILSANYPFATIEPNLGTVFVNDKRLEKLNEINTIERNIITYEDPVENKMEGLNQSQVRSDIGYTFLSGLRSALRQDPDVIMVWEIRDKETLEMAMESSMTGHLVFSTIHTNSAV